MSFIKSKDLIYKFSSKFYSLELFQEKNEHLKICQTLYNFAEKCVKYNQLGLVKKTLKKFTETKCENQLSEIILENECSLFDMIKFQSDGDKGSLKSLKMFKS